ncbi:ISAs1 family transposase [Salinispora mooreana]|uniref:ISAs1 family transposase n=1 Tax=Salinispora mooreana TaxID=999545 RepID=UPI001CC67C0D|nr:ISAs1 family transposase [Salinispora mooreana]
MPALLPPARARLHQPPQARHPRLCRGPVQALDPDQLTRAIGVWLAARSATAPSTAWRAITVDGKTLRGSRTTDTAARHVLAACDQVTGVVLASTDVDGKTNEITRFAPLLDQIGDLRDTVITADALHCQRDHVAYLAERGAHWILTVKANHQDQSQNMCQSQISAGVDNARGSSHQRKHAHRQDGLVPARAGVFRSGNDAGSRRSARPRTRGGIPMSRAILIPSAVSWSAPPERCPRGSGRIQAVVATVTIVRVPERYARRRPGCAS